jgi:hypothetical protein
MQTRGPIEHLITRFEISVPKFAAVDLLQQPLDLAYRAFHIDAASLADCRQLHHDPSRMLLHDEAIGTQGSDSVTDVSYLSLRFAVERAIPSRSGLQQADYGFLRSLDAADERSCQHAKDDFNPVLRKSLGLASRVHIGGPETAVCGGSIRFVTEEAGRREIL